MTVTIAYTMTPSAWPPCPDCGAAVDERCSDDCPRIAGQRGLTFDGTAVPVVRVETAPEKAPTWCEEMSDG